MTGYQGSPFGQSSPLVAPRPQAPPSAIPSERLANQADQWVGGQTGSPAPPPLTSQSYGSPMPSYGGPGGAYQPQQPLPPPPPPPMGWEQGGSPYLGGPPQVTSGGDARRSSYGLPPPNFGPPLQQQQQQPPPQQYQQPQYQQPPQQGQPLQHSQSHSSNYQPQSQPQPPPPPPPSGQYQQTSPFYHGPTSTLLPPQQQRPPRAASMMEYAPPSLDSLSLGPSPSPGPSRRSYYATGSDGPPYKLSVVHPDQKMLAGMREACLQADMNKKVAWAKQVLKFIERHQAGAGESSRINDPTLVRWTDEALNYILTSATSSSPVPLALFLRGDLSSSGAFPSYVTKAPKLAFRDFESAANLGYERAWFRIGRAYEDFGDVRRAVGAYEKGVEKGDCGSTYRLAMAYLLGQIGVQADVTKAIALLKRAADTADLDTPQPPYILGMLLSGEFESPTVQLPKDIVPLNVEEAKSRIERAAYLSFGPAQYKMGFSYEYATLGCSFEPLLSVQYYALASQSGEVEADMALSKWYLCGSEGNFEKNEALAVTFAEKAASRSLPSAEFALGYYREVGINGQKDIEQAKRWYTRAASHGNVDARDRLDALGTSEANVFSRTDHESQIDQKLVRKRTQAQSRSNAKRERIEANNLAVSLAQGPPIWNQQSLPGNYATPGMQRPLSVDMSSLRRRDTITQVEAALLMHQAHASKASSISSGNTSRPSSNMSQYQSSQAPGRQTYQLSDAPAKSSRPTPAQVIAQQAQTIPVRAKPETFAEMGIVTQKAKKDECLVM